MSDLSLTLQLTLALVLVVLGLLSLQLATLAALRVTAPPRRLRVPLLPAILLSGFAFPFDGMPVWAQWLGEVLPATHFLRIVRGILLKDNGFPEIWPDLWPLILFTFVVGTIALARFRRTLD